MLKMKPILSSRLLADWYDLGFCEKNTGLLLIIPPIQTAWAEGYIQSAERRLIESVATNELGFKSGTREFEFVRHWLDERPTEEFFDSTEKILNNWLETLPQNEASDASDYLLSVSFRVAKAMPAIGFTRSEKRAVNNDESVVLRRITENLRFEEV